MKRLIAGLCVALLFIVAPAGANTGFTLYHVSELENVDYMFAFGLAGEDGDYNPINHASGASCAADAPPRQRSAYVALTSEEHVAEAAGRANPRTTQFWIYRIRPDHDAPPQYAVYNVARGLGGLLSDDPSMHLRRRVAVNRLFNSHAVQETYIARSIPGRLIEAADLYARNAVTQRVEFVRTQVNPNFVMPAVVLTRTRFDEEMIEAIVRDGDVHRHVDVARAPDGRVVTVCLLSGTTRCGNATSPRRMASTSTAMCMREPLFEPGNLWDQVVEVVLSP